MSESLPYSPTVGTKGEKRNFGDTPGCIYVDGPRFDHEKFDNTRVLRRYPSPRPHPPSGPGTLRPRPPFVVLNMPGERSGTNDQGRVDGNPFDQWTTIPVLYSLHVSRQQENLDTRLSLERRSGWVKGVLRCGSMVGGRREL